MSIEVANSSSDGYYFLPYTLPVHLPGLVSTNPGDSPHMPLPQKAVPPEVPGFTDIFPEVVGTDFGMETSFKYIPNDYEVLKSVIVMMKLAPLAAAGGGINPRYADDVFNAACERVAWQVGGATIQELTGDEMHFKPLVECPPEEYSRLSVAQYIDTDAQRTIFATTGGWVYAEVPFWWTETAAKHWHQYACQRQTRIRFKWRPANQILQQDNVNAVPTAVGNKYIQDIFMRFRISALDTAVKDTYTNSVKAQGSAGLNYLTTFTQKQENNVVSVPSNSTTIQLTNFNKPTYMLRFIIRTETALATNCLTGNRRFEIQDCSQFRADASGHIIWPLMSSRFAKLEVNGKEFLGNPMNNVFHVLHTDYADVVQYPMGCVEYGKLQNPTLTINWANNLQANMVVDIYAYCYDYLRLVITQDNRSAVNLEQPI
jgi:hypothetical protein